MTTSNEIPADLMLNALVRGILDTGHRAVLDGSFVEQIGPFVEHDTTAIVSPEDILRSLRQRGDERLLDFGCGTGGHRAMIEGMGYHWQGVNHRAGMAAPAAAVAEKSADPLMSFYDGLRLPFDDGSFDVVWSFQAFEHIQSIEASFTEIRRVLKPKGSLVGAVSYLEQIHDYSSYNFTPYGLKLAAEQAGLKLVKLYPRCDAFTFLLRRLLVATTGSDDNSLTHALRADNVIGRAFLAFSERLGLTSAQTNLLRLMFSSHIAFHIVRPADLLSDATVL